MLCLILLPGLTVRACPVGDLNGDCKVDLKDLQIFARQWLDSAGCSGLDCANLDSVNGINVFDFALLADNWREELEQVLINEFMAINDSSFVDGDGNYSDWIELLNTSDTTVNLNGWYLTDNSDDLSKWPFPEVNIEPGQYLVVFASEKKEEDCPDNYPYLDPGGYYHTNFRLDGSGEYLALVRPNGIIAHEYAPEYPQQFVDVSYGLATKIATATTLIASGDQARCFVPVDDSLGSTWTTNSFDDSAWTVGTTAVGYETSSGYEGLIGLDIETEMYNENATCYIRIPFTVNDPTCFEKLWLQMKYDDGFIAYLNDQEVASRNAYKPHMPDTGLVSFWDFEGDILDRASQSYNYSGSSNDDLTPQGGTTRFVQGMRGQAVAIGQQGGDPLYFTAPVSSDVRLPAVYSIEAWIKPSQLNEWNRLVLNWANPMAYHFAIHNQLVSLYHNGLSQMTFVEGGNVVTDEWQHIAGVADGTDLNVYLNGQHMNSTSYDGTINTAVNEGLGIGSSTGGGLEYKGLLDELAIWEVPLTAGQVQAHFGRRSGRIWPVHYASGT